jgi:hypothetical protein
MGQSQLVDIKCQLDFEYHGTKFASILWWNIMEGNLLQYLGKILYAVLSAMEKASVDISFG